MAYQSEDASQNCCAELYICLQDALDSFNNSINEEQAWAVFYLCAQYLEQNSKQEIYRDLYYYGITAIQISKDGDLKVEVNFSQGTGKGPPSPRARQPIICKRSSFSLSKEFKTVITEQDVVQALGTAIYKALNFGLSDNEEPDLSPDLEVLIEFLTDHPTDDDEGIDIERDSDNDQDSQGRELTVFQDVINRCIRRLSSQQNAQLHYKAVCRALATEASELTTFLDNIKKGHAKLVSKEEPSVDDLERSDWARLWVQIMRQLRHGVRLKKVDQDHLPPVEFELTPFEILLEDIRLGRFKLNRVSVNASIPPKVKDDAHAVILDFIRSRPPLKPVSRRKLNDIPVREMDPREKLMSEIRNNPVILKPVKQGKVVVRKPRFTNEDHSDEEYSPPAPTRKIIKPVMSFQAVNDFTLVSTDDSDSYVSETDEEGRRHIQGPLISPLTSPDQNVSWQSAVARDLAQHGSSQSRAIGRRHTISACDTKNGKKHKWQNPIECLSLTLEEVIHIRTVLTKAELESLIMNPDLYTKVGKGKICFTCKKTEFKFFKWGTKCKFCGRSVCNYCLKKMSVPTEHFEKIPVYTLSPVPLSPEVLEALKVYESTGSVPHSPATDRKSRNEADQQINGSDSDLSPASKEEDRSTSRRRSLQRSHTIGIGETRPPPNKALLQGPQVSICCDCKSMVMEIIRASRSSVSHLSRRSIEVKTGSTTENKDSGSNSARGSVVLRPRKLELGEEPPRPRSMLANINFKSFNLSSKFGTDS
ncbi:protein spire homolog 1-like isoform X6 [Dreissena polymorpha]|uniref:protein spire homolog 1-like isoform X6 n=1 Tax=Dreissena polymorpha TaxID=45954 RepID=UPI002264AE02|nr:protein spire homolog 1-like isoform X6 [Dreissena polymorpha]